MTNGEKDKFTLVVSRGKHTGHREPCTLESPLWPYFRGAPSSEDEKSATSIA